jgi:hypothetical protein
MNEIDIAPLLGNESNESTNNNNSYTSEQSESIKCVYNNEIRNITINVENLNLLDFSRKLYDEYKKFFILTYIDDENDKITIRSEEEFNTSLEFFKSKNKTKKYELKDGQINNVNNNNKKNEGIIINFYKKIILRKKIKKIII